MKKNILYIGTAVVVGLLIGWLVFSSNSTDSIQKKEVSGLSDAHDHTDQTNNQIWTCSMHPQIM